MALTSDLDINVSKLRPEAVSDATNAFNEKLISILSSGPKWYEVSFDRSQSCFECYLHLTGWPREVSRDAE